MLLVAEDVVGFEVIDDPLSDHSLKDLNEVEGESFGKCKLIF